MSSSVCKAGNAWPQTDAPSEPPHAGPYTAALVPLDLSVVVPVYNAGPFIASLISSMQSRLAALEKTIWQANPRQTNTSIKQVCDMSLSQGEWLTPADWHPQWARES